MKIVSLEIFYFEVPLIKTLNIKNNIISTRKGFIIRIEDNFGNVGIGEISPLPGFHKENLNEVKEQLRHLKSVIREIELPEKFSIQSFSLLFRNDKLKYTPSLQFGLDSALLHLYSNIAGKPIHSLLSNTQLKHVSVNGLLIGNEEDIIFEALNLIKTGYKTLKIKVGRNTIDSEIALINNLRKHISQDTVLRLDANQAWDFEQAKFFLDSIGSDNIEFIEEPLNDVSKLEILNSQTNFPIALDESLSEIVPNDNEPPHYCTAFILKPTLIGNIQKTLHFIQLAKKTKIVAVISDTFQTGVGISILASIAAYIGNENLAMGLDTYSWLKKDILKKNLKIASGKFNLNQIFEFSKNIEQHLLNKIDF